MLALYLMMLTHFVADWLLQSRKMGKFKSSHPLWLCAHIGIIWVCFLPFGLELSTWNAGIHAVIDVVLWNLYKVRVVAPKYLNIRRFAPALTRREALHTAIVEAKAFNFFNDPVFKWTVGFDQMLHYATLLWVFERFYIT